ncbi:MAG: phosphate ABC transporter permease PstA [Promethearchaeia archaeon]
MESSMEELIELDEDSLKIEGQNENLKESVITKLLLISAVFATIIVFLIILFLFFQAGDFFQSISLVKFLFTNNWRPTYDPPGYGAFAIILGSFLVTFGAIVIAIPLGIFCAIFISEIAPPRIGKIMKAVVEILSGIPSVVFGFFGLIVLDPWIQSIFNVPTGATWLAGSIILAVMALPTIVSVSEDAISSVPKEYKEGSLALGSTKWQMIWNVLLPAALSGITAAIILGIGRAIGETMAVMMVTGNVARIPNPLFNVFSPIRTITGTIAIEMGEAPAGSTHQLSLYALAIVLFIIVLVINTIANIIKNRISARFKADKEERKTVPETLKRYKKPIFYLTILVLLNILFINWFGILMDFILMAVLLSSFYLIRKLSARNQQFLAYGVIVLSTIIVLTALGIILYDIISKGLPALSIEFLTESPRDLGREGGIFPAIVGTLFLVMGTVLFAVPIGIAAGIYLAEYAKDNRFIRLIRLGIDNLNGTPSIVFGLFGYTVFVLLWSQFGIVDGRTMLAGQLTMALMILPTIIRTTEEALISVPQSVRDGSLALGSSKWQSISRVALPAAIPGVITGIILGMGRSAGETAPILFTATTFQQRFLPRTPLSPVMALPYHLFVLSTGVPHADQTAAGTALVLLILVVLLYSVAIYIRNYYQKKIQW